MNGTQRKVEDTMTASLRASILASSLINRRNDDPHTVPDSSKCRTPVRTSPMKIAIQKRQKKPLALT